MACSATPDPAEGAQTDAVEGAPAGLSLLVVDDHPLFREALASAVRLAFPGAGVDEADTLAQAACRLAQAPAVDLVLLDLALQGVSGFDGLVALRARFPRVPILVVSGLEDPRLMREAIGYGAAGFVPKAVDRAALTRAIGAVMRGELVLPPDGTHASLPAPSRTRGSEAASNPPIASRLAAPGPGTKTPLAERVARLTPQQRRVLAMIRQGRLNKQIAHALGVGGSTVKAHVSEILRKLEVISRTQIVIDTAALDFDQIHNAHRG